MANKRTTTLSNDNDGGKRRCIRCDFCDKTFTTNFNCCLHMRSHHRDQLHNVIEIQNPHRNGYITEDEFYSNYCLKNHQKVFIRNIDDDDAVMLKDRIIRLLKERMSREMLTDKPLAVKVILNLRMLFKYALRNETIYTDPPVSYHSRKAMILYPNSHVGNSIEDNIEDFMIEVGLFIDEFVQNGSGWVFDAFKDLEVTFMRFIYLTGSSYIKTPTYLEKKHALVNVQNNDQACFKWSILSALHPTEKNPQRISKYTQYENDLDDSDLVYPVDPMQAKELDLFANKNNVSFSIILAQEQKHYTADDKVIENDNVELVLLHNSKNIIEDKHIFLMLLMKDDGEMHYCWIKSMSRLMRGRIGFRDNSVASKKFCPYCLFGCMPESYEKHVKACRNLNVEQVIRYPNEQILKWGNLNHLRKTIRLPFIIYADFESILEETANDEVCKLAYQRHIPISYCLKVICKDKLWDERPIVYTGLDCMEKFFSDMIKINEKIRMVYALTKKMDPLTEDEQIEYEVTERCYICKKKFNTSIENDKKVRDHCHLTGKYIGPICNYCNLNVTSINYEHHPIICVFHNLKGYDMHHILHNLTNQHVNLIGTSSEKFLAASIRHRILQSGQSYSAHRIKYIDSASFLQSSLAKLAENLPIEKLHETRKFAENIFKEKQGVWCYPEEIYRNQSEGLTLNCIKKMKKPIFLKQDHDFDYRNYQQPQHVDTPPQAEQALNLLRQKGVYPYDWMDNAEKMSEPNLPPIEAFYNKKDESMISEQDYRHAQTVWNFFGCRNFQDYHELYLQTDVMLLTDIFEEFRTMCLREYKVDPAGYISLPAMSWDAMLRLTEVSLELFQPQTHEVMTRFERAIRGGISIATKRHAIESDKQSIIYLDANNLYGWAMSQPLPTGDFKTEPLDYPWRESNDERGAILEVDVEYPKELHDYLSDLPPLPSKLKVTEDMLSNTQQTLYRAHHGDKKRFLTTTKLIPTLLSKTNYIAHQRVLKQAESLGVKITKIHTIISFKHKKWLAPYIDLNTRKRAQPGISDFEKNLYKLMNNSVFGKTMENVRKHRDYKIINIEENCPRIFKNPRIYATTEIGSTKLLIELRRTEAEMNKPLYIGMCILDLSKVLMYDFHYNFTKKTSTRC